MVCVAMGYGLVMVISVFIHWILLAERKSMEREAGGLPCEVMFVLSYSCECQQSHNHNSGRKGDQLFNYCNWRGVQGRIPLLLLYMKIPLPPQLSTKRLNTKHSHFATLTAQHDLGLREKGEVCVAADKCGEGSYSLSTLVVPRANSFAQVGTVSTQSCGRNNETLTNRLWDLAPFVR